MRRDRRIDHAAHARRRDEREPPRRRAAEGIGEQQRRHRDGVVGEGVGIVGGETEIAAAGVGGDAREESPHDVYPALGGREQRLRGPAAEVADRFAVARQHDRADERILRIVLGPVEAEDEIHAAGEFGHFGTEGHAERVRPRQNLADVRVAGDEHETPEPRIRPGLAHEPEGGEQQPIAQPRGRAGQPALEAADDLIVEIEPRLRVGRRERDRRLHRADRVIVFQRRHASPLELPDRRRRPVTPARSIRLRATRRPEPR